MKRTSQPPTLLLLAFVLACGQPASVPTPESAGTDILFSDTRGLAQRAEDWVLRADTSEIKQAMPLLDSALAAYRVLKLRADWVSVLWNQCGHLARQKDDQAAFDLLEKNVALAWWDDDGLKGQLYFLQGILLRKLGRNYAAMCFLEKAKTLSENFGGVIEDENPAGPIYKTLANIKTRLGENEEAEKILRAGLALLHTDTDPDHAVDNAFAQADIYSDLGAAYQNKQQANKALNEYEAGLQTLSFATTLAGDPDAVDKLADTKGMLLANKAGAMADLGQLSEAETYVKAGLATITPGRISYRFNTLIILAEIEEMLGRASEALRSRDEALRLAFANKDALEPREIAKLLNTMGWAAYRHNDFAQAEAFSQKALNQIFSGLPPDDTRRNPDPANFVPDPENAVAEALDLKSEAQWQLYQITRDPKRLYQADSTTSLAILMMENLRNAAVYESSKLGSAQQSRTLFGRMFRILYARQVAGDAGIAARAFEYSEKSKAVLLHQKVSADAALKAAGVADSLLQQEHDLKERWAVLRGRIAQYRTTTGKENDTLNLLLYRIEDQQRVLRQRIGGQYNLSPDGRTAKTASAREVQDALLRTGETWISYLADRDSGLLYSIAVDADGVHMARRPYRDESVLVFIRLINDRSTADNRSGDPALLAEFVRQSRSLYENLVQPALPNGIIPKRLAISPDGALALLPFDVLLCQPYAPDAGEPRYDTLPYLAQKSQTRLSPSASLELFYARQPRQKHKGMYIGFAPDYANSPLGQVVSGTAVVQAAEKAFGGKSYTGTEARLDSFLRHAASHAILHFHGHAEASDSLPDQSWMAFSASLPTSGPPANSQANLLFAYQIYHSHLGSDLVLLSACRTGLGRIALGEGTMSLSRAFQAAGCPATVMSLWEVRDDATAALMGYFLENIRNGQDKDEALANAKRTYLDSVPDAFPYYWAGFVLAGTSDPVALTQIWWQRPEMWMLAASLAAAVWWFWRQRKRRHRY